MCGVNSILTMFIYGLRSGLDSCVILLAEELMKKLLLATVALTVIAAPALAADKPVYKPRYAKSPVYKAPPIAYLPAAYDWSGLYFGGHVGWGHVRDTYTTNAASALLAIGSTAGLTSDQFIGGIQAGYNMKLAPNIILGFEGEFTWLTAGSSSTIVTLAPGTLTYGSTPDWVATAAGRLGYAANNMMIYAKGGAAWMETNYSAFTVPAGATGFAASNTRTGYVVGGGLEYGLSTNWSAKAEYAYLDFGTAAYNVSFGGAGTSTSVGTDMHQVKVGLNYRFGSAGFGGLIEPVVAKY